MLFWSAELLVRVDETVLMEVQRYWGMLLGLCVGTFLEQTVYHSTKPYYQLLCN